MTKTIEQLTARVRELEEELQKANLQRITDFGQYQEAYEQLATSQAYAEQLRAALEGMKPLAAYGRVGTKDVEQAEFQRHLDALSLPNSTSALDAYVAEKVKPWQVTYAVVRTEVFRQMGGALCIAVPNEEDYERLRNILRELEKG